jgi:transposase-like protein
MERIHQVEGEREEHLLDLDEIARAGARRMLACALEAEVEEYVDAARGERDEHGRALVVRNGYAREREVLLGAGAVEVRALPRVNDRRVDEEGNRKRFSSVILPPYMRKSPKVTEVLPLLYLHGLSSGDFVPALEEFFGTGAGLGLYHHPSHRAVARGAGELHGSRPPGERLRLRLGGWHTYRGKARSR